MTCPKPSIVLALYLYQGTKQIPAWLPPAPEINGVAMAIYTIDDHNTITLRSAAPAGGSAGVRFDTAKELAIATAEWPVSRLADTWNKLPIGGLKPVKKFMDRKTAVARIWAAIQNLTPVPEPAAREGSKKALILAMLRTHKGATLGQIMEYTGWQPHTVRRFISGAIGKQLGLKVESTRTGTGERRYRILA